MNQKETSVPIPTFLTQRYYEKTIKRRKMIERIVEIFKV